jgi:Zn-finger nucleic acid-binding protein
MHQVAFVKLVKVFKGVCPHCGRPLAVEEEPGVRGVRCPRCHLFIDPGGFAIDLVVRLGDCEIRDWERIGRLSSTNQEKILQALESGMAPREIYPLLLKLKEMSALICT